jgi:hypothetical protein
MQKHDPSPELEAIRQLPLEKRYVWRIASALKWGLADCDDWSVKADTQTLTAEDFARVMDLLKFRPMQLAIVLKALVGEAEMERVMIEAMGRRSKPVKLNSLSSTQPPSLGLSLVNEPL